MFSIAGLRGIARFFPTAVYDYFGSWPEPICLIRGHLPVSDVMPFRKTEKHRATPLFEFTERGSQRQGRHSGFLFLESSDKLR